MANSKESRLRYKQKRLATQRGHIEHLLGGIKIRARKRELDFNLTLDYLESIATLTCPVLGIELSWGHRNGTQQDHSPSLDRIDPSLGYTVGNVVWLSQRANTIKNNGTASEHERIAEWMRWLEVGGAGAANVDDLSPTS
jgi:hypothetical protein